MRLAELHDLLDHVPLLIHLDRIHGGVAAGVLELLDRLGEALGERFDARAQDVGETEEDGQLNALPFEIGREIAQVERVLRT